MPKTTNSVSVQYSSPDRMIDSTTLRCRNASHSDRAERAPSRGRTWLEMPRGIVPIPATATTRAGTPMIRNIVRHPSEAAICGMIRGASSPVPIGIEAVMKPTDSARHRGVGSSVAIANIIAIQPPANTPIRARAASRAGSPPATEVSQVIAANKARLVSRTDLRLPIRSEMAPAMKNPTSPSGRLWMPPAQAEPTPPKWNAARRVGSTIPRAAWSNPRQTPPANKVIRAAIAFPRGTAAVEELIGPGGAAAAAVIVLLSPLNARGV